jgi:hypothetical protein
MLYYFVEQERLLSSQAPPNGVKPLKHSLGILQPRLISQLHYSFRSWGRVGFSPGALSPNRVYCNEEGLVAFCYKGADRPHRLLQIGTGPDLAAWLVLLDKWMETYVVIARARTVWNLHELASALSFVAPAFLPPTLVAHPPDNWERVAVALSHALADGSLQKSSTNVIGNKKRPSTTL